MGMYVKNPIPVKAFQFGVETMPDWFIEAQIDGLAKVVYPRNQCSVAMQLVRATAELKTNHGTAIATYGDWIIKGHNGELYPCENDVFTLNYSKYKR